MTHNERHWYRQISLANFHEIFRLVWVIDCYVENEATPVNYQLNFEAYECIVNKLDELFKIGGNIELFE